MSKREGASHELDRWAARQAPAILRQAQAQAVHALRDALVRAALAPEQEAAPAIQTTKPADERPEQGELLWAYCVMRANDLPAPGLEGVDPSAAIERAEAAGLAALVSRVPRSEFGAEPLRRNLNNLAWLERVARRHEAVLDATLATTTIVPLRMCTLYESLESVRQTLERERASFVRALEALDGRLEWAVKVMIDRAVLEDHVRSEGEVAGPQPDTEQYGEGGAYLLRRRSERAIRDAAASLATEVADRIHARLQDWAIDATARPPQNRELSGHHGEMVLNGAYLVERARSDELHELVSELEDRHRELGVAIELSGPWPPYNFIPAVAP